MSSGSSLTDSLRARAADPAMISQVCVDLVSIWAGGKDSSAMYRELLTNARSAADVDQMLYQLEGDPGYAENAALIVLSAAWNYPELAAEIQELAMAAGASPQPVSTTELAQSVLYGMYLMAREGAQVEVVAYRNAQGQIETRQIDGGLSAAVLFDAVRDQYGQM